MRKLFTLWCLRYLVCLGGVWEFILCRFQKIIFQKVCFGAVVDLVINAIIVAIDAIALDYCIIIAIVDYGYRIIIIECVVVGNYCCFGIVVVIENWRVVFGIERGVEQVLIVKGVVKMPNQLGIDLVLCIER